jgi:hypothetical protein
MQRCIKAVQLVLGNMRALAEQFNGMPLEGAAPP